MQEVGWPIVVRPRRIKRQDHAATCRLAGSYVGGVVGVGLTKGVQAVSTQKIVTIFVGWILTPTCAAIFAAVMYRLLAYLLH